MSKLIAIVLRARQSVGARMTALSLMLGFMLVGGTSNAFATTPTDPLNGAGTDLANTLVSNFVSYVIPAVVVILGAVYAFKLVVKLGTRYLNRA